ncbi:MAG: cbb3-type cytochrome c oxidase subunit I, partial [Candidatus Sericytochromatia bacterium]
MLDSKETVLKQSDVPIYDDAIVRKFSLAALVFAIVGMLVGVWIAGELAFPFLNLDLPWISFGRLRPLHTNVVIFAFGGNLLFAAIYYSLQRTSRVRLFSDFLSNFTFWQDIKISLHQGAMTNTRETKKQLFNKYNFEFSIELFKKAI